MASGCVDQHKFHHAHQLYLNTKKSLRDLDIPPRKLLGRRSSGAGASPETFSDVPDESLFQKFLPYNSGVDSDSDDADPYSADHFRMYEFKVRKCTRSRSHDWTDCPFAHPGEKARRRCPRRYSYSGTVCPDFRRGSCARGDLCEFAHGVFECWLHPSRYRTEACKDGKNCQRKICFFAHTPRQLRVVPAEPTTPVNMKKYSSDSCCHYCVHCRCFSGVHHADSPTSTLNIDLDGLSPPASPPFSPARSGSGSGAGFSPISRFADRFARAESCGLTQFRNPGSNSMNEVIRSMEAMNMEDMNSMRADDFLSPQSQFDICNSDPISRSCDSGQIHNLNPSVYADKFFNEGSVSGPDLGWVNDLLT